MSRQKSERELAVDVSDLSVHFGNFAAVDGISFQVPQGEIFGFLGANGAGKTTTIRVLCGLLIPTQGRVRVAGVGMEHGANAIKAKVGYMSQKFTLYNDLSVEENLSFIAALRKLEPATYIRRRKELFDFISFNRPVQTIVQDLPGGTKQQISLAASLLHDPEIVFLDEPTAGVSPASRSLFWSLIRDLAQKGKTVFVTTHYMDEAEQCQRIALMREGKIVALDTPERLKKTCFPDALFEFDPKVPLTYEEISQIGGSPVFSYFEPYGLRFHAAVHTGRSKNLPSAPGSSEWEKIKPDLEKKFKIRSIQPSLEDVFIHTVEGKKR